MNATRRGSASFQNHWLTAVATGLALTACSSPPASTPAATGAPPTATSAPAPWLNTSYNQLMVAWIDNASHVLWDVEKPESAPKNTPIRLEAQAIQVGGRQQADPTPGERRVGCDLGEGVGVAD